MSLHAICPTTLALSSFSILLNGLIMCNILGRHTHRSLRPSQVLIANLAFVTNMGAVLGGVYFCSWDKYLETLWICSVFSYLRSKEFFMLLLSIFLRLQFSNLIDIFSIDLDTVANLFSLSVLGVSYEMMRSFQSNLVGELLVSRLLCFTWSISILGGIPSLFATRVVNHTHFDGMVHVLCVKVCLMRLTY